jgi:hypothetical protein
MVPMDKRGESRDLFAEVDRDSQDRKAVPSGPPS